MKNDQSNVEKNQFQNRRKKRQELLAAPNKNLSYILEQKYI